MNCVLSLCLIYGEIADSPFGGDDIDDSVFSDLAGVPEWY
jgi:hypothetical protein